MTGAPEQLSNRDEKDKNETTSDHQNDRKCNERPDVPRSSLLHKSLHTKRLALLGAKCNLTLVEDHNPLYQACSIGPWLSIESTALHQSALGLSSAARSEEHTSELQSRLHL